MNKILALVVFSLLAQSQAFAGPSVTSGSGNPASNACEKLGGKSDLVADSDGNQSSMCKFGTAVIEEWLLFQTVAYDRKSNALTAFFKNTENKFAGNTENFCLALGGSVLKLQRVSAKGSYRLCRFQDGSLMEVNTLFAGPRAEANAKLVKVLTK